MKPANAAHRVTPGNTGGLLNRVLILLPRTKLLGMLLQVPTVCYTAFKGAAWSVGFPFTGLWRIVQWFLFRGRGKAVSIVGLLPGAMSKRKSGFGYSREPGVIFKLISFPLRCTLTVVSSPILSAPSTKV